MVLVTRTFGSWQPSKPRENRGMKEEEKFDDSFLFLFLIKCMFYTKRPIACELFVSSPFKEYRRYAKTHFFFSNSSLSKDMN
jgi:hypothetical protein